MNNPFKDKNFYFLWLASMMGQVAVLPYVADLSGIVVTPVVAIDTLIKAALWYAAIIFFGIKIVQKTDFKISSSGKYVIPSTVGGISVGLAIRLLDHFIFSTTTTSLLNPVTNIKLWHKILGSFYGAINEEILLRLFAVSLITVLLQKNSNMNRVYCTLISILFCALLFGIGHLPMLYKIIEIPRMVDIVRVLTLNGIGGIVFGLLYWRYGLISSMLSHFIADLIIHVF